MLTIKTWRDPYESGFSPTKPTQIVLEPGLTVLVGCNGAGKTTLLCNIRDEMKRQNIPCHFHNNLNEGGSNAVSEAFYFGNISLGAGLWSSSEGEAIKINFGVMSAKIKRFLEDGFFDTRKNRMAEIFREKDGETEEIPVCNKRVLLFDAVDSGLSVDSVVEIKSVFDLILQDAKALGVEVYLVISANEYELARGERCFDVNDGKYLEFADYEAYRYYILKSREKKEKRIQKQELWFEKKKAREAAAKEKRRVKYEPLIAQIKEKAEKEGRDLSWSEKSKIQDYERWIENGRSY